MEKETISTICANLALFCFIVGNVYTPAKWIRKHFMPASTSLKQAMSSLLEAHIVLNILGFIFAALHGHYAESSNFFLFLSMILMTWLFTGGFLLRFKLSRDIQRRLYWLHSQQYVFLALLISVIAGHIMVD